MDLTLRPCARVGGHGKRVESRAHTCNLSPRQAPLIRAHAHTLATITSLSPARPATQALPVALCTDCRRPVGGMPGGRVPRQMPAPTRARQQGESLARLSTRPRTRSSGPGYAQGEKRALFERGTGDPRAPHARTRSRAPSAPCVPSPSAQRAMRPLRRARGANKN